VAAQLLPTKNTETPAMKKTAGERRGAGMRRSEEPGMAEPMYKQHNLSTYINITIY